MRHDEAILAVETDKRLGFMSSFLFLFGRHC